MAEKISGNVCYDHASRGIFYAYPPFHADEQHHGHCQHGEEKLVIESRISAYKGHYCMEQRK